MIAIKETSLEIERLPYAAHNVNGDMIVAYAYFWIDSQESEPIHYSKLREDFQDVLEP